MRRKPKTLADEIGAVLTPDAQHIAADALADQGASWAEVERARFRANLFALLTATNELQVGGKRRITVDGVTFRLSKNKEIKVWVVIEGAQGRSINMKGLVFSAGVVLSKVKGDVALAIWKRAKSNVKYLEESYERRMSTEMTAKIAKWQGRALPEYNLTTWQERLAMTPEELAAWEANERDRREYYEAHFAREYRELEAPLCERARAVLTGKRLEV